MKFRVFAPFLTAILPVLLACAPQGANERRQTDRVIQLLDEKRYDAAIHYLELDVPVSERDRLAPYLAQAYLGRSGFEPLEFAYQILAEQRDAEAQSLRSLIPDCDPAALSGVSRVPVRCIVWRVFAHVPDHASPDFARARAILRAKFPEPRTAPAGYNALAGIVEAVSLLSAFKNALRHYEALDAATATTEDIRGVFERVGVVAEYSAQLLRRSRAMPYLGISKKLSGFEQAWLLGGMDANLDYVEETGLPLLIQLAQKPLNFDDSETAIARAVVIQAIDQAVLKLSGS